MNTKITITKTTYSDNSKTRFLLIDNASIQITQKQMDKLIKELNLKQVSNFGGKESAKAFESYTR